MNLRMSPPPLRMLLTGLGAHGHDTYLRQVLPARVADGRITVAGLIDPNPQARERASMVLGFAGVPIFSTLRDAVSTVPADALIVCSPYAAHVDDCLLAARHGLDLFIEKPVGADLDSVCRLIHSLDGTSIKAAVNMSARFETEKLAFARALESGAIGRVEYLFARSSWNHEGRAGQRAQTPHPYLTEAGVHALDLLRTCAGGQPTRVFNLAWPSPGTVFRGNASTVVSFEMSSGVRCVLEGTWTARCGLSTWRDEYIRADGETGSLLLDRRELTILRGTPDNPNALVRTPVPYEKSGPDGTTQLFGDFIDWVQGQRADHPTNLHANLDCMALLFAANASADSGEVVDVPDFLRRAQAGPGAGIENSEN